MKNRYYCNPLPLPAIPRGKDDWYPFEEKMFSHENKPAAVCGPEYRSVSDPTVLFWDNKWYLYPSYGMAYVSEDFVTWQHIRTEPYCPKYSPAVTPWRGRFLMTGWLCPLYISDNPLGPFTELGKFKMPNGSEFVVYDPALFTDDNGRLFLYAFDAHGSTADESYTTKIVGYELDSNNPCQVITGPTLLFQMNPRENPWERQGYHNQNTDFGWVEGPHMLKYRGRYYLIYAAPDTRDGSYCMAVYYSDESPLGPFVCQKRNPLTLSRHGLVSGAGHGCVEKGPDDALWAFYTVACPRLHQYERRIGMDRVAVDENGELYCPAGVTDSPQQGPLSRQTGSAGLYNLTEKMRPVASSNTAGRDAMYATDGSNLTFWQPAPTDDKPTLTVAFDAPFALCALRLFWAEDGYNPAENVQAGPVGFLLEGLCNGEYKPLLNAADNGTDYNIDYREFPETVCSGVRVTITRKPQGIQTGIIDFSVFGRKATK